MEINKVRVNGTDYDIKDTYPKELSVVEETIYKEILEEKECVWGDISKANSNSVIALDTFWMTDYAYNMIGKTLKSVTINGGTTGGIITFRGNNITPIDRYTTDLESVINIAKSLNDSNDTIDIFTIKVETGFQTYLLDGTDSRVTILNQNAINSCPSTIGVGKTSDTSTFKFNYKNLSNEGYIRFYHQGMEKVLSAERTNGLAISFKYDENSTIEDGSKKVLQLKMNNDSILELELSALSSNVLKGKKISILGDSISTFNGYIPSGYAAFYPTGDITSVEKTWWYQLINENGMELIKNASWSGSSVTGDSTSTTNAFAGCSNARINALSDGTNIPDIIIIYIGINDFALNFHRELGDYIGDTAIPSEGNITTFSEAYGLMVKKMLSTYPKAKVFCCTLLETAHSSYDTVNNGVYPTQNNNNVSLGNFNERIKTIANRLGANIIDLHECGINYWNLNNNTIDLLHPNTAGALLIKKYIENALLKNFNM